MGYACDEVLAGEHQIVQKIVIEDHVSIQPQHVSITAVDSLQCQLIPCDIHKRAVFDVNIEVNPIILQPDGQIDKRPHEVHVNIIK